MRERYFFGILLIIVGLGLFFEQLDLINFGRIISLYWPIILIILGLVGLFDRNSSKFWNTVLIVVGTMLQINRLGLLDINIFRFVVPIIITLLGFKILLSRNDGNESKKLHSTKDPKE